MLTIKMKHQQEGFTLVEAMFTILVLAVLLSVGVPNFRDFLRNSRMTAVANDLLGDYNYARSEAVKRRLPVTICKTPDGAACATTTTASFDRWIVFLDRNGDGLVTSPAATPPVDVILKDSRVTEGITGTSDGYKTVFRPSGFPDAAIAGNASRVLFCDARKSAKTVGDNSAARGLSITATGRAAITRDKAIIDATAGNQGFGGCP
jgi:type IV fimbrial biogenesis protein FimT